MPGWSRKLFIDVANVSPLPLAFVSEAIRSSELPLPNAWLARYSRMPARNVSSPTHDSNMREHARAFLVGDAVERGLDVAVAVDRLAHLARGQEAVVLHRRRGGFERFHVAEVFRFQRERRLALRPGRERLVEPDVVPPRHRDEIAVPLVRDLVRVDVEDAAIAIGRASSSISSSASR